MLLGLGGEDRRPGTRHRQGGRAPAGYSGRLEAVTATLAEDREDWAGVRELLIRPDGYVAWSRGEGDATASRPDRLC